MARLTESAEVREEIVRALRLDLIGPWADHPLADERLRGWKTAEPPRRVSSPRPWG